MVFFLAIETQSLCYGVSETQKNRACASLINSEKENWKRFFPHESSVISVLLMMEGELAQNEKWQNIEGNINFSR